MQAERDPDEEGDFMAFEQLMAESMKKKEDKKKERETSKDKQKEHAHQHGHHHHPHMPGHGEKHAEGS
jgi:hypothetical protein